MKTLLAASLVVLSTTAFASAAVGTNIGDKVPAFTGKAMNVSGAEPKATDLDSQKTTKPTVYLFIGTQCGTTQAYVERLRELEQAYAAKGVDFVYVYPNKTDSTDAKTTFHKEKKLTGALVDDQNAVIAKALGAQRTAEAVIVAKDGQILYRGAIDDAPKEPEKVSKKYVAVALDEHLAGKPVTTTSAPVAA